VPSNEEKSPCPDIPNKLETHAAFRSSASTFGSHSTFAQSVHFLPPILSIILDHTPQCPHPLAGDNQFYKTSTVRGTRTTRPPSERRENQALMAPPFFA
jgi:hypothetical protein